MIFQTRTKIQDMPNYNTLGALHIAFSNSCTHYKSCYLSIFIGQSWIWMQQAMHPELNYSSCFRKKWVQISFNKYF